MPETTTEEKPAFESKADTADKDVLKTLRAAARGLLFPSESDKPVKAFLWEVASPGSGAVVEAAFRVAGKIPAGALVETQTLQKFFEPVIVPEFRWGDEEKATAKRFTELVTALNGNLTDISAFRVKGADKDDSIVDAYVVGRTAGGDLAGVFTQLIET